MSDVAVSDVKTKKAEPGGIGLALDFGPLLLFFIGYKVLGVFAGTAIFMVSIAVAVLVSKIKLGRVSPMLWLSAILVIGFGALTLYFHDARFIQHKPSVIYALLAALLGGGLAIGKPPLKYLLEVGYPGLSDRGWSLLSRNWALFFLAMAVLNEVLVAKLDFGQWLAVKVWGITILSVLFGLANIPLLMKHGLKLGAEDTPVPPQG